MTRAYIQLGNPSFEDEWAYECTGAKPPAVMNSSCLSLARAPRTLEPLRQILKFVRVHTRSMNVRPTKSMDARITHTSTRVVPRRLQVAYHW